MRWPNDEKLAKNVDEIDLILGGHDHDYTVKQVRELSHAKTGVNVCRASHYDKKTSPFNPTQWKLQAHH